MLKKSIRPILLLSLLMFITSQTAALAWHDYAYYGDWNYHGSGRDHPYSAYIDRSTYVGSAEYAPRSVDYIDASFVLSPMPAPVIAPVIAAPPTATEQYVVNIPNSHGGFNAVVIQKSGEGFIGPRGEYYPEFPKVFQLQMKYSN